MLDNITTITTDEYRALVERSAYLDIILGSLSEKKGDMLRDLCDAITDQLHGTTNRDNTEKDGEDEGKYYA